jgi:hypothetical protein
VNLIAASKKTLIVRVITTNTAPCHSRIQLLEFGTNVYSNRVNSHPQLKLFLLLPPIFANELCGSESKPQSQSLSGGLCVEWVVYNQKW